MYGNAAVLAAVVLIYSAVAGRVMRSWVSGPIVFTCAGLLLGPAGMGALQFQLTGADLRTLAEISLAMVLFTDAAHVTVRLPCAAGSGAADHGGGPCGRQATQARFQPPAV